jgi:hypothetical protein
LLLCDPLFWQKLRKVGGVGYLVRESE